MNRTTAIMQIQSFSARDGNLLLNCSDAEATARMSGLIRLCEEKYNGHVKVEICPPYKSRTTGKVSQNNKFYALITEICKETGNDLEDVKDAVKERAIKRGYPYSVNKITGQVRPYSTTNVNTVEMSYLIDEAMQLCAELGINPAPDEASEKEDYDIF